MCSYLKVFFTKLYDIKYSYLIQTICTQLFGFMYSYQIQIICRQIYLDIYLCLSSSRIWCKIWPIDGILTHTNTPVQSRHGSNCNERTLYIPEHKNWSLTTRCSFVRQPLLRCSGRVYPSAIAYSKDCLQGRKS